MAIRTQYNQDYYYRSKRRGRRVISVYVGNMREPHVLAQYERDQRNRQRRLLLRASMRCMDASYRALKYRDYSLMHLAMELQRSIGEAISLINQLESQAFREALETPEQRRAKFEVIEATTAAATAFLKRRAA